MDIQKELQDFRAVAISKGWDIDGETTPSGFRFYSLKTNTAWEGWQAKAQAVPEGFVLMPRDPSLQLLQAGKSYLPSDCLCSDLEKAYLAMIEAQEQSHE